MAVRIALYPLFNHGILQQLGLRPAIPLFPFWTFFLPFSSWSPLRFCSLRAGLSVNTLLGNLDALLVLPAVWLYVHGDLLERLSTFYRVAIERTIFCPEDPGDEMAADITFDSQPPSLVIHTGTKLLAKLFTTLGWGRPFESRYNPISQWRFYRSSEVGTGRITNLNRLDIPAAHSAVRPITTGTTGSSQDDVEPIPRAPSSPGNEGVMEAFPEQNAPSLTSSTDEVDSPTSPERRVASPHLIEAVSPMCYRVTSLAKGPTDMLRLITQEQLVRWTLLPIQIVVIRLIASHYLRSQGKRVLYPNRLLFVGMHRQGLRSIGIMLSRVALCSALEVAFKLGLWGCQWAVTRFVGRKWFSWGKEETSGYKSPDSRTNGPLGNSLVDDVGTPSQSYLHNDGDPVLENFDYDAFIADPNNSLDLLDFPIFGDDSEVE